MNTCKECGEQTKNAKFCSRSCSATYTNRTHPKRKPESRCVDCGKSITAGRARCREHYKLWQQSRELGDLTLNEAIYHKSHRSSAFALVRSRARGVAKKLGLVECQKCGYNKHVEIAHVKPISNFEGDALLSEINSPDNLMALCPNCHWEFDHAPVVQQIEHRSSKAQVAGANPAGGVGT